MKFNRALAAGCLAACMTVGLAVPAMAGDELRVNLGEAKFYRIGSLNYDRTLETNSGVFPVENSMHESALVNLDGEIVASYQGGRRLTIEDGGLFLVREAGQYGLLRADGSYLVPMQNEPISLYHGIISMGEAYYDLNLGPATEEQYYGMAEQKEENDPELAQWSSCWKTTVNGQTFYEVTAADGSSGLLDGNKQTVIAPGTYQSLYLYQVGDRMVALGRTENGTAMLNDKGQVVVPEGTYTTFYPSISSGIKVYNGEQKGVIDASGRIVVPLDTYYDVGPYSPEGYVSAYKEDPVSSAVYDLTGRQVASYSDRTVATQVYNRNLVFTLASGEKGMMTVDGQEVIAPIYTEIEVEKSGRIQAICNDYSRDLHYAALYNGDGSVLLDQVEGLRDLTEDLYQVRNGELKGLYSVSAGRYLLDCAYSELDLLNDTLVYVEQGGRYQVLNCRNGTVLAESGQPIMISSFSGGYFEDLHDNFNFALTVAQGDILPFVIRNDLGAVNTVYINFKEGTRFGCLPMAAGNFDANGWFPYQDKTTGMWGIGRLAGEDQPAGGDQNQPSGWAAADVNAAVASNLVPRQLQSSYTAPATRAEFCALAVQFYETVTGTEVAERKTFTDTTDVNVEKAAALGVVDGIGNGAFDPQGQLTREQAAAMLSRLAAAAKKPLPGAGMNFADAAEVSSWAAEAVGQMQASGVMGGVGDNRFDPKGTYTREQSIITSLRLFRLVNA